MPCVRPHRSCDKRHVQYLACFSCFKLDKLLPTLSKNGRDSNGAPKNQRTPVQRRADRNPDEEDAYTHLLCMDIRRPHKSRNAPQGVEAVPLQPLRASSRHTNSRAKQAKGKERAVSQSGLDNDTSDEILTNNSESVAGGPSFREDVDENIWRDFDGTWWHQSQETPDGQARFTTRPDHLHGSGRRTISNGAATVYYDAPESASDASPQADDEASLEYTDKNDSGVAVEESEELDYDGDSEWGSSSTTLVNTDQEDVTDEVDEDPDWEEDPVQRFWRAYRSWKVTHAVLP